MIDNRNFDVIIIGGSYAGLSTAMSLGRSLRSVLVVDSGKPCNIQTPHSHNFLTQDGRTPKEISTLAKRQVAQYDTVKFYDGLATAGRRTERGFELSTSGGDKFEASKLVFATGIMDMMPDIKGFKECWGITVIHCPYCHGFEHKGKSTAIIGNGPMVLHLAPMVRNLSQELIILTNGKADFDSDQIGKLNKNKIKVIEIGIAELEHTNGHLKNVVFTDGNILSLDVAYGVVPFTQHSNIPELLGCELTEQGYIKVDVFQKTTIDGVFACGDNSSMMRSVANAVYGGNVTGAVINGLFSHERF